MNPSDEDPLLARIRALPRPRLGEPLSDRVRQLALTALEEPRAAPAGRPSMFATVLVAGGVLAYFGWAIAFLLAPLL